MRFGPCHAMCKLLKVPANGSDQPKMLRVVFALYPFAHKLYEARPPGTLTEFTIGLSKPLAGSREPEINRQWIEDLYASANRNIGMTITPEPRGTGAEGSRPQHEAAEVAEILESLVATGI